MKLISARMSQTVVMYLLLMLVSVVTGVILLIPGLLMFMLAFPVLISGIMAKNIGIISISIGLFFIMGIVMVFLNGILQTYMSTAWTLAFLQLTEVEQGPKAGKIPVIPKTSPAPKALKKPRSTAKPRGPSAKKRSARRKPPTA